MKLSIARKLACDALIEVIEHKKRPEDISEDFLAKNELSFKDKRLFKELLYGSLRWYIKIFWILQNTSKRDLKTTSPEMRATLVVGTYQIFYLDRVPDRAAVNDGVEYLKVKGEGHAASFANGILRQIARKAAYFPKPDKDEKPAEYLEIQFSHPKWMIDRWLKQFQFARLQTILTAQNEKPPITARINLLKHQPEQIHEIQEKLLRDEKTHTTSTTLRGAILFKDPPNFDEGGLFSKGSYTIQDESSQIVGMIVDPKEGETIADVCCGPGGKFSHIYELGKEKIDLIGIDRSHRQFTRTKETMARMGHSKNITWIEDDVLNWSGSVDKILLDAPCSGLGVLSRHPEGKFHKDPASITVLAKKQKDLISHCIKQLKPGGRLVYSVCSYEKEESVDQLNWIQKEYSEKIEIISPVRFLPDYFKRYVTRENIFVSYPGNQDHMDGFSAFAIELK